MKSPFHSVNISPWPLMMGLASLTMTVNLTIYMWMHWVTGLVMSTILTIIVMSQWWRDVIREATWCGDHTINVQSNIKLGMFLFILSEIMFFVSFFWAFFHSALSPSIQLGMMWPPMGIQPFDPLMVPMLNTVILLSSGATLTWSHMAIMNSNRNEAILALGVTVLLALLFTSLQLYEYYMAPFTMADGVYGSVFFMATGFHGFHVIIGSSYLIICLLRLWMGHFSMTRHLGLELAAWYWHFVDVVWLFLYLCLYWWGG